MGGKVPPHVLERIVFRYLGAEPKRVLLGPAVGEDAAVIDFGEEKLVVHTDPITGATNLVGWLAIHVPCNDVACSGGDPLWVSVALLVPSYVGIEGLEGIAKQIDEACRELGASVIGGHTEFVDDLRRPIAVSTCMGVATRFVPTSGARVGDVVIATKFVAIEGTAILATDFEKTLIDRGVPREVVERAKGFYRMVSVVREARVLREFANSMHDPTEGGIVGGLLEVAKASRVGIVLYEDRVPIARETLEVCRALGVDPLKLISSGCLLATIPPSLASEALEKLREVGVEARVVGRVVEGEGEVIIVRGSGERERVSEHVEDELYRLLSEFSE